MSKKKEVKMSYVYLFKLTSKEGSEYKETAFKIGRSIDPERRAKEIRKVYDVEIIDTLELEREECLRLENTLHSSFYRDRYYPKLKFDGQHEVFKNKMCFRQAKDFLLNQYNAINDPETRFEYYKDKKERAKKHKAKYWAKRNSKKKNNIF